MSRNPIVLAAPLLALLIGSCAPQRERQFTIIYSNDVRGDIVPCG